MSAPEFKVRACTCAECECKMTYPAEHDRRCAPCRLGYHDPYGMASKHARARYIAEAARWTEAELREGWGK